MNNLELARLAGFDVGLDGVFDDSGYDITARVNLLIELARSMIPLTDLDWIEDFHSFKIYRQRCRMCYHYFYGQQGRKTCRRCVYESAGTN